MKEETKQMGLMKKLTSAIVASSLVFSLVGTAFAAYTPAAGETAGNRMMGLQILKGKYPTDALALKDEITRAELVTVIVRAFGQESNAALLKGAAAYPDTANHWASGNIAMAKALVEKAGGDAIGMPDGSFNPDGKLTPAQAVAFLMKFLGVKADATKTWPNNFLDKAVELNIITAEDKAIVAPMLNDNATRGLVFYLFDRAFYSYDLGAGKTFYTKYVDTTAPVVTLGEVAATTIDSKVTITGKVEGATEVYVGTKSITVDANGNFSADYELPELKEYAIAVTARDVAGNVTEKAVAVTRTVGNVASIEATDITVAAGATVEVKAAAKDAKGNTIANATIAGESAVGTFEAGKFTAGKTAGEGTLTLKAGEITKDVKVTVTAGALAKIVADKASVAQGGRVFLTAQDANGNTITGVTYTVNSADAYVDQASGGFVAFKTGTYTVTAKQGDATATLNIGVYDVAKKLAVEVSGKIVGNFDGTNTAADKASYQTVTVKVLDANGNVRGDAEDTIAIAATGLTFADKDGAVVTSLAAKNGVATFRVYAPAVAAGQIIKATATSGTLTAGSANVEVVGQVATSVKMSSASDFVGVDAANTLGYTVTVVDQNGIQMRTGSWDAKVTLTGPAIFTSNSKTEESVTATNGVTSGLTITSKQYTTGAITLTATVEGIGTASKTVNAVFVGAPKSISVSASKDSYTVGAGTAADVAAAVVFTAKLKDAQGALVKNTDARPSITLDLSHLTATEFASIAVYDTAATPAALTPVTGTQKYTINQTGTTNEYKFQVFTSGKFLGDLKLVLTGKDANDAALTSAEKVVTVKHGAAAKVVMAGYVAEKYLPVTAPNTSFTAVITDSLGNVRKVADAEITFGAELKTGATTFAATNDVSFNGTAQTLVVKTDAEGKATVNVVAKQYVNNVYRVTATSGTLVTADNSTLITIDSTATAGISLAVEKQVGTDWVTPAYLTAGDVIRVKANVTDTYGVGRVANTALTVTSAEKIFDANGTTAGETLDKGDNLTVTWTNNGGGSYTSSDMVVGKAGLLTFSVKDANAATTVSADASVLVYADVAAKATVAEADSSSKLYVTQNSISPAFTVKLADKYGNAVTTNSAVTVTVGTTGTEAAKVVTISTSNTAVEKVSSFTTRGTTSLYLGVTDLAKTGTPATLTLTVGTNATNYTVLGK